MTCKGLLFLLQTACRFEFDWEVRHSNITTAILTLFNFYRPT